MVTPGVAILVGLMGILIGALGAAWVLHVKWVSVFTDRIRGVEDRVTAVENGIIDERTRTDTRIFEVVGLVKEIIKLAASDREEWRNMRADMKVLIQEVRKNAQ